MDISNPPQARRLPQIFIQSSNPSDRMVIPSRSSASAFRPSTSGLSSSIPMSIPNTRDDESYAPPPLPPPRYITDVKSEEAVYNGGGSANPWPAWNTGNQHSWGEKSSVKSEPSLYGSFSKHGSGVTDELGMRRGSSNATIKSISELEGHQNSYPRADEGYASLSTTGSMSSSYSKDERAGSGRSGFQSSVHDRYRADTGDYDKGMLNRLDWRRRPDMATSPQSYHRSSLSRSLNEAPHISRSHRYAPPETKPFSLPVRPKESPRWGDSNGYSSAPYNNGPPFSYERRSPSDRDEMERSPRPISRQNTFDYDDGASNMSRSYNEPDFVMDEAGGMQRLHIDDSMRRSDGHSPNSAAGQKRRASSPLVDDTPQTQTLHPTNSMSDLRRRRESAASRVSPAPSRQHSLHGSVSSTASGPRSNSFSAPMLAPSNSGLMSVDASYGNHLSPGGLSSGGISPRTADGPSPFATAFTVKSVYEQRPVISVEPPAPEVRPIASAKRPIESLSQSKSGVLKVQSGFVCDCCPKKPKKFETEDALNAHEAEKQYECAYCKNRFKNKNEAERHQNSLHLRRHSWSCAALTDYGDAFHDSPSSSGMLDTCGYCGDEFQRNGRPAPGNDVRTLTDSDWNDRVQHLVDVHKFRECNHTKKFFRADHFRQHLKHSHAGTSGKWTNMLENACMKDEPLPEPIRGPEIVRLNSISGRVGRINEEDE